jgi:hypothetical protein
MNDMRYYELLDKIAYSINGMDRAQTEGAFNILSILYAVLNKQHFEENREDNNMKALVKTIEELLEHAFERKLYLSRPRI